MYLYSFIPAVVRLVHPCGNAERNIYTIMNKKNKKEIVIFTHKVVSSSLSVYEMNESAASPIIVSKRK